MIKSLIKRILFDTFCIAIYIVIMVSNNWFGMDNNAVVALMSMMYGGFIMILENYLFNELVVITDGSVKII